MSKTSSEAFSETLAMYGPELLIAKPEMFDRILEKSPDLLSDILNKDENKEFKKEVLKQRPELSEKLSLIEKPSSKSNKEILSEQFGISSDDTNVIANEFEIREETPLERAIIQQIKNGDTSQAISNIKMLMQKVELEKATVQTVSKEVLFQRKLLRGLHSLEHEKLALYVWLESLICHHEDGFLIPRSEKAKKVPSSLTLNSDGAKKAIKNTLLSDAKSKEPLFKATQSTLSKKNKSPRVRYSLTKHGHRFFKEYIGVISKKPIDFHGNTKTDFSIVLDFIDFFTSNPDKAVIFEGLRDSKKFKSCIEYQSFISDFIKDNRN